MKKETYYQMKFLLFVLKIAMVRMESGLVKRIKLLLFGKDYDRSDRNQETA
jgi:hypothetical protein